MWTVATSIQGSAGWRRNPPSLTSVGDVLSLGPCGTEFQTKTLGAGIVTGHKAAWSQSGATSRRTREGSKQSGGSVLKALPGAADTEPETPMLE